MRGRTSVFGGSLTLEVTGAEPERFLNLMAHTGIRFSNAVYVDECTLRVRVAASDGERARECAGRALCSCRDIKLSGAPALRRRAGRRKALVSAALLCILLLFLSSLFVWDIEVTGCENVSVGRVLRSLSDAGAGVGTLWYRWDEDAIKNSVLLDIPELGWLGISVSNSRAVVRVRERVEKPEIWTENAERSVYASATGIITRLRVYSGTPLVSVGDAVIKGEELVSGAVADERGGTKTVSARADIEARTFYELTAAVPLEREVLRETGKTRTRWAVLAGGDRVDLYSDAPEEAAKRVTEYPFSIKGLFTLPITLVKEEYLEYDIVSEGIDAEAEEERLRGNLTRRLEEILDGRGEIVSAHFNCGYTDSLLTVTLRAECLENIAKG